MRSRAGAPPTQPVRPYDYGDRDVSLNLNTPRANRITPGDFEGSAPNPASPSDYIPLRRRCVFPAVAEGNETSAGASWSRSTAVMPMGLEYRHAAQPRGCHPFRGLGT